MEQTVFNHTLTSTEHPMVAEGLWHGSLWQIRWTTDVLPTPEIMTCFTKMYEDFIGYVIKKKPHNWSIYNTER